MSMYVGLFVVKEKVGWTIENVTSGVVGEEWLVCYSVDRAQTQTSVIKRRVTRVVKERGKSEHSHSDRLCVGSIWVWVYEM